MRPLRWLRGWRQPAPSAAELRGMTKEGRLAAVARSRSERQLRDMWAVWRAQGWSDGGMLHRAVLDRIHELRGDLSATEDEVRKSVPPGLGMPPITGRLIIGGR